MRRPDRILLVDDEPNLIRLVRANLVSAGFEVLAASDGAAALRLLRTGTPDLVVLDVMLPDLDGFELCEAVRERSSIPILMLTARSAASDKVRGLELGADDYLAKPFDPSELLARVRALLRRARRAGGETPTSRTLGDLCIDDARQRATLRGRDLELTPTEFRLLSVLAEQPGTVLAHAHLLSRVWGPEYRDDVGFLRQYVYFLRQKLEDEPRSPRHIKSRPGFGYYLAFPEASGPVE
jgi:two-component system KDP operon response regulator KdpE